jgi:hypothetical protein
LKSLHKCFLYDNDQKILDSSNFQVCSLHVLPLSLLVSSSSHWEIIDPFLDHEYVIFLVHAFLFCDICFLIYLVLLQVLLKPIVSQFVVEPPGSNESVLDTPSVEEVDETLVLCLGQMAVTARSDVLWKPLNHEV